MESETSASEDSSSFLKKAVFVLVFFLITPIALGTSLISLATISKRSTRQEEASEAYSRLQPQLLGAQVYASLPNSFPSVSGEVTTADARVGMLKKYLDKNSSLLYSHADYIVEVSEKYNLDYRLTTAIAQKESGLCRAIPEGSNNCWGWGIHSQGTLGFDSLEEGVETVSKGLKEFYMDEGYETVEDIMTKYAHPSSTTWAEGVLHYMSEIQN